MVGKQDDSAAEDSESRRLRAGELLGMIGGCMGAVADEDAESIGQRSLCGHQRALEHSDEHQGGGRQADGTRPC